MAVVAKTEVTELKVVVFGDYGVGKSTVIYRLCSGVFDPNRRNVICCDFMRTNLEVKGATYRLCLWDTAGQERFAAMNYRVYLRNVCCVILMFALDDKDSFTNLDCWLTEVLAHITDPTSFPFVLIGNKSDLAAVVAQDDIASWCREHYNMPYYQCSAKTGEGITQAFTAAVAQYASLSPSARADLMKATPIIETTPSYTCC